MSEDLLKTLLTVGGSVAGGGLLLKLVEWWRARSDRTADRADRHDQALAAERERLEQQRAAIQQYFEAELARLRAESAADRRACEERIARLEAQHDTERQRCLDELAALREQLEAERASRSLLERDLAALRVEYKASLQDIEELREQLRWQKARLLREGV